jgi:hypothetical protein
MDAQTFADAREAWKMQVALTTFNSVRDGIGGMLERGFTPDLPEYYPLSVGLICLYGRPFKIARPFGKLDDSIVPLTHAKLHLELLRIRDRTFAHSDPSVEASPWEVANELRFERLADQNGRDRIGAFIAQNFVDPDYFKQMVPLLDDLIDLINKRSQEVCGRLSGLLPKARGQYVVNVLDADGPLFLDSDKAIADVRHLDLSTRK